VIGPDGKVIPVRNGEMEIHITADIACAIWQYWQATGDEEFLRDIGAEILLESARMWATRGRVEDDGLYHIRHVIGPDEYHEDVDDSAYTNLMASWNMKRAVETAGLLRERWPAQWRELAGRLQLVDEELQTWSWLADIIYTGFDQKTGLFEQFSGYYQKDPIDLKAYEPRHSAMDVILGHERIQATNVVKQADVIMAMYLLWDQFTPEVRERNFRYYEPRTGHGSSLSPSIHALVAARFGEMGLAQAYLHQAAEIDLGNNMGNAAGGVHAAAIGGLWQAVVFGFAGMRLDAGGLEFAPHLLPHWRRLAFPLQYRGRLLHISMEPESAEIDIQDGPGPLRIACCGQSVEAHPHRRYAIELVRGAWQPWREA
jgi:kojibiose phosphorylase